MTQPEPERPADRFQRLRELFEAAKERPPAEREAFVRRLAGADQDEVLALLRADAEGRTTDLQAAGQAGLAEAAQVLEAGGTSPTDGVQSTATAELLQKLSQAPKLDSNRYHLEGEIDRGGSGVILRIHDRHLNRRLAMKVLRERRAPRDEDDQKLAHQILGRFLEEAQVTSQLDHPGVVPVHELGLDQTGKVYFTMRLVKGQTAGEILHQARAEEEGWTTTRALEVILKVCDTMAFAHDKGVLHRDLKPGNVMVGKFGEVYVMDWGLAKVLGQEEEHDARVGPADAPQDSQIDTARKRDAEQDGDRSMVTRDHHTLGTPRYMAPEQARREALDARADVYAIGTILYQLLTGQAPYAVPGPRQEPADIVRQVLAGPPKRIEDLAKGVPAELVAITEKAMARDRNQRYASAVELAADLRAFLDQRSVKAHRTGALVELKLWVRRNKPLAASLVAAVLILVAGIAGTTVYAARAKENETIATTRANENAQLAQEKGALAAAETKAKDDALREKGRADSKVKEFDQLAGVVLYERAIANEKELYPAWPHMVEAMERWLKEDAAKLLAMKDDTEQTVRDLESRSLPATAEEQEADRRSHPRFAAFEVLGKRVASLRYAQAIREGKAQLVLPVLTAEQQALDAKALNQLAWPRVASPAKAGKAEERTIYGEEAFGLACARAAVAKAYGTDGEYQMLDTLAWACLANGQDAEARTQSAEALGNAPDNEHEAYVAYHRDLESSITKAAEILALAERELTDLTTAVNERRTFRLELEEQQFLHDTLAELLGKLASLQAKEKAEVEARLAWANQVQELSLAHPKARHRWADVRAAIAGNEKYAGQQIELRDEDITGLVPIGENPVTHLWEFYELRSAWDGKGDPREIAIPAHKPDGSITMTDETGIVFVLLPGGRFTMGAQKRDPKGATFDPCALSDESPVHEITLAPFFLARYELTRGHWQRLMATASFYWKEGVKYDGDRVAVGAGHPADSMDWDMANRCMERHGLVLPTEAQWEYGCRAGTTTAWWPGQEAKDLQDCANVNDQTSVQRHPEWATPAPITDAFAGIARVGSFRANAFGLHDVHGNVWEWCRDWYGHYDAPWQAGDGLRLAGSSAVAASPAAAASPTPPQTLGPPSATPSHGLSAPATWDCAPPGDYDPESPGSSLSPVATRVFVSKGPGC